nr:cuticle protein 19-like [Aedes albopictus]
MFKIIALVACLVLVVVSAEYYVVEEHQEHDDHYDAYPKYKFEYGVMDPHTGDHKSQWEHRDGDVVVGSYSVDEADGTHRVVTYNSDDHNGFQAHVQRVGHAQHPHGESYSHIDQHH